MKQSKQAIYGEQILKCLLNGETYTIVEIAERVGLSEKTVRIRMDQINTWLIENEMGIIKKKTGTGIWLESNEKQRENLREYLTSRQHVSDLLKPDNRNKQLIGKLLKLKPGEITTLKQLADSLYLSPPTVGNLLREVAEWFQGRKLLVTSVRSKGVCVQGNEYNFRIAIKDYMMEMMPEVMDALMGTFAPRVDTTRVRRIVVEAENAWHIEFSDWSFNMVWIMVCLSIARNHKDDDEEFIGREEDVQHYNEYAFAESIYQRIEKTFQISIPENDTRLLAVLLLTVKKLQNFSGIQSDYAAQYDQDLGRFVCLVIDTIDSVLDIDLSGDTFLYESLMLHLRSAIFRMKYSTTSGDSVSKYVKSQYKQTFLATWATSNLFEEYYDVQVTEDELAGIALYIQAAIVRRRKGSPMKILLVSAQGMASNQLHVERLKCCGQAFL